MNRASKSLRKQVHKRASTFSFRCLSLLLIHAFIPCASWTAELCSEREIRTEIVIETSADRIWKKLCDFEQYPEWHTYLLSVEGKAEPKSKIHCVALNADSSQTTFSARILEVIPNHTLSWGGSLGFLFNAKHYFILEALTPSTVRLIQGEYWKGLFGKSYGKKIYLETYQKFVTMNERLKLLLENAPTTE